MTNWLNLCINIFLNRLTEDKLMSPRHCWLHKRGSSAVIKIKLVSVTIYSFFLLYIRRAILLLKYTSISTSFFGNRKFRKQRSVETLSPHFRMCLISTPQQSNTLNIQKRNKTETPNKNIFLPQLYVGFWIKHEGLQK